jgi:hypothetical protein
LSTALPLRLELSSCPALASAIVTAHAAAGACIALVLPLGAGMALGTLVLALGTASAWHRALLRGPRAVRAIEIASGAARVIRADGSEAQACAVRGIGITRWWVALQLGPAGRGGFLISAGMLESEPFRRLRLWALWDRAPGVARGQLQG